MKLSYRRMIKSPGVTGKSERAGHNSVALPTAAGRREGDRICPALTLGKKASGFTTAVRKVW